MEDGKDSAAGPSQCRYLAESSAETSSECSRRLPTFRRQMKRLVHRRSQERKKITRKSSNVKAHIGESSQARLIGSLFMVPLLCSVFLGGSHYTSNAQFLTCALCAPPACAMCMDIGTWCTRHHTHVY